MAQLIYHSEEGYDRGESPFDRAIKETADSEEVLIVCPYIAPTYLESVLREVDEWQIITDVVAWVGTFHGESRDEIKRLIEEHQDRIHHFRHVHAKVVLSDDSAIIGSANLTEKGVIGRTEMGVRFSEEEKITEVREWFSRLWSESSPVGSDELQELVRTSPSASSAHSQPTTTLSSDAPRVNASFAEDIGPPIGKDTEVDGGSHESLVRRVRMAPSREWADVFLGLMSHLISATGLPKDDPRLVTGIAQDDRITLSINTRMVIGAFFSEPPKVGFIIGDDAENVDELIEESDCYLPFNALPGEEEEDTPHWMEYEGEPERMVNPAFRGEWMRAAFREIERASGSIHQSSHEPLVYQAAVDESYRKQVLRESFLSPT